MAPPARPPILLPSQFLYVAVDSGLLPALAAPRTRDELARDLAISSFYIALLHTRDRFHQLALELYGELAAERPVVFVTSEAVLVETLTRLSKYGPFLRKAAAEFVAGLPEEPRVVVEDQTRTLFFAGLDLHRRRLDKNYSMTDCMSMVICRERGVTDVLTADHDFEQEGFAVLLKRQR